MDKCSEIVIHYKLVFLFHSFIMSATKVTTTTTKKSRRRTVEIQDSWKDLDQQQFNATDNQKEFDLHFQQNQDWLLSLSSSSSSSSTSTTSMTESQLKTWLSHSFPQLTSSSASSSKFELRCPKCKTTEIKQDTRQVQSIDEGMKNFYQCKNKDCLWKWRD